MCYLYYLLMNNLTLFPFYLKEQCWHDQSMTTINFEGGFKEHKLALWRNAIVAVCKFILYLMECSIKAGEVYYNCVNKSC